MAQTTESDLRQQVEESNEPEVVRQRDLLESGEDQPTYKAVASIPVLEDTVEVAIGESVEIPFDIDPEALTDFGEREGTRAMLVIRERSLTDNSFGVRLDLATPRRFDNGAGEDTPPLTELFFFDHTASEEHQQGDVMRTDAPLGHFFIDASDVMRALLKEQARSVTLRVAPALVHDEDEAPVPFTLGGISIDVVPDIT